MDLRRLPPRHLVAAGLAAVALLALLLIQFLPWAILRADVSGVTASAQADTWQTSFTASGFGETTSRAQSWYNSTLDDQGGIQQVRWAGPVTLVALAGAAAALALVLVGRPRLAPWLAFLAAAAILTALLLMQTGVSDLFDGKSSWAISYGLAVAAIPFLVAAGATAFPARPATAPA